MGRSAEKRHLKRIHQLKTIFKNSPLRFESEIQRRIQNSIVEITTMASKVTKNKLETIPDFFSPIKWIEVLVKNADFGPEYNSRLHSEVVVLRHLAAVMVSKYFHPQLYPTNYNIRPKIKYR
jgi:hypothetical protein